MALAPVDGRPEINEELAEYRANESMYPRIQALAPGQVIQSLSTIVANVFMIKGLPVDTENMKFIAGCVYQQVVEDSRRSRGVSVGLSRLTLEEINSVLRTWAMNTEERFVSAPLIYKALRAYCTGYGRKIQIEVDKRKEAAKKAIPAPPSQGRAIENQIINVLQSKKV